MLGIMTDKKEPKRRRVGQKIDLGEKRWKLVVFAGYDPLTGKRKYKSEIYRGGSKDADKRLNDLQHKANNKALILKTNATFNDLLDEWMRDIVPVGVNHRTLEDYRYHVDGQIRPALGSYKLSELDSVAIQKFYTQLTNNGLAPRTIALIHQIVGAPLRYGVKRKLIAQNPALDTIRPKVKRADMKFFTPEEALKFLQAAKGDEFEALFVFALDTGMRPEEYLGLWWSDLNLQTGVVNVRRKLDYESLEDWAFDSKLKSERAYRLIHLAPSTVKAVISHKAKQDAARLKLGSDYTNHNLVFARKDGQPLNKTAALHHHFKNALKRAGLNTQTRLYDLRHSSATLLLAAGVDAKTVSERLGHADEGFTLRTYAHVIPSMRANAATALEKIVFSHVSNQFATLGVLERREESLQVTAN